MARSVPEIKAQYGLLTVLYETRREGVRGRFFLCRCECGAETLAYAGHLRNGSRKSCGCLNGIQNVKHGLSRTPEYRAWESAKGRCTNPHFPRYRHYGARGISMCARWAESFAAFRTDMGPRPSPQHSLDREDNDGNYEPGNCRWATSEEQNNNRSINRRLMVDGERMTVAQAGRATGIPGATILSRLDRGLTDEEAIRGS